MGPCGLNAYHPSISVAYTSVDRRKVAGHPSAQLEVATLAFEQLVSSHTCFTKIFLPIPNEANFHFEALLGFKVRRRS